MTDDNVFYAYIAYMMYKNKFIDRNLLFAGVALMIYKSKMINGLIIDNNFLFSVAVFIMAYILENKYDGVWKWWGPPALLSGMFVVSKLLHTFNN
jgi:hypothetical protein